MSSSEGRTDGDDKRPSDGRRPRRLWQPRLASRRQECSHFAAPGAVAVAEQRHRSWRILSDNPHLALRISSGVVICAQRTAPTSNSLTPRIQPCLHWPRAPPASLPTPTARGSATTTQEHRPAPSLLERLRHCSPLLLFLACGLMRRHDSLVTLPGGLIETALLCSCGFVRKVERLCGFIFFGHTSSQFQERSPFFMTTKRISMK